MGLIPFGPYFMVIRANWPKENRRALRLPQRCLHNWSSFQNYTALGVSALTGIYLVENNALSQSISIINEGIEIKTLFLTLLVLFLAGALLWGVASICLCGGTKYVKKIAWMLVLAVIVARVCGLAYNDWQSHMFLWFNLTVFYFLEAGIFLVCLYQSVQDKRLFTLNAVALYIIPTIYVGNSCDFCMRASIPGLVLIYLWCVSLLAEKKDKVRVYVLTAVLVLGAVTPLHEIKRSYVNSANYYENYALEEQLIFRGRNFSGDVDSFFWKYIAKDREEAEAE